MGYIPQQANLNKERAGTKRDAPVKTNIRKQNKSGVFWKFQKFYMLIE